MTDKEILALSLCDLGRAILEQICGKRIVESFTDSEGRDSFIDVDGRTHLSPAQDIVQAKILTDAIMTGDPHWDVHISCYGVYSPPLKFMVEMVGIGSFTAQGPTEEEARARAALMAYWRMKR